MRLKINPVILITVILLGVLASARGQMTPQQAIVKMTRGINLGRCLEQTTEGASGGTIIQEYFFDDITNAGFNFVRLPVQWNQHAGTNAPYTVDSAWLNRVQQVVTWGLKRGLIIIVNSHHDRWILENASYTTNDLARFKAIWTQAADRLKTNSANLIFEIANEPIPLSVAQMDQINSIILPVLRSNNPTRIIIYSGNGYTSVDQMMSAAIPIDPNLMTTFHSYDPWSFAGLGQGTWGTAADKQAVTNRYETAAAWSKLHNIPVILGEWGTISSVDAASRQVYIATYAEEASRTGVAPCIWNDFGSFGIYYPNNSATTRWSNIKDLIMSNTLPGIASATNNAPPTLNAVGDLMIYQSAGQQTVNLTGITSGSGNEVQTLTVTAISSNPGLIPTPTVAYTSPNTGGTLTFAPVPYATGTATITVTVNDGQSVSNLFSRTFTVRVNALPNLPFAVSAASVQPGSVGLKWASMPGKLYAIQYSLDLQTWVDLMTNLPASAGTNTSFTLDLSTHSTGTNDLLVQYQMGQAGPQVQDATNSLGGGPLTAGTGATLCNVNASVSPAYASQPELQVGFSQAGTNLAMAMANQTWFKFSLTVGRNVSDLELTGLSFNAARGGAAVPRGFGVYATTPTTTDELIQGSMDVAEQRPTWGNYSIDLSGRGSLWNLKNGQVVTFTIPVYAPSPGNSLEFDNFSVYGKSTYGSVPAAAQARGVFLRIKQ